jgi:hypothetical protein
VFQPGDLIYTEEAVVMMDLIKTTSWKALFERASARARSDGRGLVTLEDVLATLGPALESAAEETRRVADAFAKA